MGPTPPGGGKLPGPHASAPRWDPEPALGLAIRSAAAVVRGAGGRSRRVGRLGSRGLPLARVRVAGQGRRGPRGLWDPSPPVGERPGPRSRGSRPDGTRTRAGPRDAGARVRPRASAEAIWRRTAARQGIAPRARARNGIRLGGGETAAKSHTVLPWGFRDPSAQERTAARPHRSY